MDAVLPLLASCSRLVFMLPGLGQGQGQCRAILLKAEWAALVEH